MRLVLWCLCLAGGIAGAALASFAAAPCAAVAAVLLLGAAGLAFQRWWLLASACVWAALGMGLAWRAAPDARPLTSAVVATAFAAESPVNVTGTVARGPEAGERSAHLTVDIESIDGQPVALTTLLSVLGGWPDLGPGERVRFRTRLRQPRGLRNPGALDPRLAFRAAGIEALAAVPTAGEIVREGAGPASGARRLAFRARRAMRAAIDAGSDGEAAAFLRTAVLGERRGVSPQVEANFRAAGATHVLSVSGLHLAAVAGLLFLLVRALAARIPRLPLWVDPRAVAAVVALPAVGFFTLLTGEAVATERSALMLAVGLGAWIAGRSPSGPASVAAAGLVLLAGSPLLLFDVSLQLSLASVVGMVALARAFGPRTRATTWAGRAGGWLWRFGAATLSATAATAPLVAHHFGEVAPAAPLGNFALVPLVELVVVPCGLLGAGLGALAPWLGSVPLRVASVAARAALWIAGQFGTHAPVWLCRMPNGLETVALGAGLVLGAGAVAATARQRGWRLGVAAALLAVASGSLSARELRRRYSTDTTVTFLDVGQGDAAVVQGPGGHTMVIDGGGTYDGSFDPGERVVEPFLRRAGVTAVDVVALSHPHPDHLNGLQRILARFPVAALWTSGDDGKNPAYGRLLEVARARGVRLDAPAAVRLGPLALDPLGPWLGDRIAPPPGMSVNDASLVVRVAVAGRAVLFPGDLEGDGEGELAGRATVGQDVHADVLKVPHHGSRTSSSDDFLDAVRPSLAVASLGWQNRFHFPSPEVTARYDTRGARLLRTDLAGAITLTIGADGRLTVRCERGCR